MSGVFDFLHIKRHTAGSSNELSFDVLDQLSAEADGKASRSLKTPKAPKAPKDPMVPTVTKPPKVSKTPKSAQDGYHKVSGSSTLSGQEEVEKRKKARRSHRVRLKAIVALVVVAVIAAGAYAGVKYYADQADFKAQTTALVNRLTDVDETLVKIDALMKDPLNGEEAQKREQAIKDIPKTMSELDRVSNDAKALMKLSINEDEEMIVGQIDRAARARTDMLAAAEDAFVLSSDAAGLVSQANAIWNGVLNSDQLAREAISQANRATTQEATTQALEAVRQAQEGFAMALADMQELGREHGIDFSDQEAYLAKKVESLEHAAATSEALLAGDRDAAKSANDAYNVADEEAVRLAGTLPPSMGDIVQQQFDTMMEKYEEQYGEARNSAVKVDAIIREYLSR